MAKILPSAVVSAVSGKVCGTAFCYSATNPFIRVSRIPGHPVTQPTREIRAWLKGLTAAWGWELDAAERAGWIAWASDPAHTVLDRFGQSIYLTGLNWFVMVNQNLHSIGEPRRDTKPDVWLVTDPAGCTVAISAAPYVLTVDPTVEPGANDHAVVLAAPPLSPGRYFIGKLWRTLDHFDADENGPYDVTAKYEAKFGPLRAGQTVNAALFFIDDRCGKKSAQYAGSDVAT